MKIYSRKLPAFAVVFLISGCASLSKEECQQGDWYGIGFSDGVQGRSIARFDQHREACAEHGVTVDISTYETGRHKGLRRFCSASNAYRHGELLQRYDGICPAELEQNYLSNYIAGLETALQQTENDHDELVEKFEDTERLLIYLEEEIARKKVKKELKEIDVEIHSTRERRNMIFRLLKSAELMQSH